MADFEKLTIKSELLEASIDGHIDVADSLQLSGQAAITTPNLRRVARWFGMPVAGIYDIRTYSDPWGLVPRVFGCWRPALASWRAAPFASTARAARRSG